jgi:phosphate transport system substrate-binding protein
MAAVVHIKTAHLDAGGLRGRRHGMQPGAGSWPITGATFILMHAKQDKPAQGSASLKFFEWAYSNGDAMATELEYVPLPSSVKELVRREWAKIQDGSGKAIAFK